MTNKMKYSKRLENPYTGDEVEIEAATEQSLQKKIEKQEKDWEKEQEEWKQERHVKSQKQRVREMNNKIWELNNNLRSHMLSDIDKWSSYDYYDSLKKKSRYSDIISPPTIKEVRKELKVPLKFRLWEHFSEGRKSKRTAAENEAQKLLNERIEEYEKDAKRYNKKTDDYNDGIDKRYKSYTAGDQQEVAEYFGWVIEQDCRDIDGYYIEVRPKSFLFYDVERKMLSVDLELPDTRRIPGIDSYEYIEKTDKTKENKMSAHEYKSFYNKVICGIVLRVICVLYKSDEYQLLDTIIVNGYRVRLDRSRGKHIRDCIISVEIEKKEYEELYLRKVDGEAVIRRVSKDVPADLTADSIHLTPIYDSGNLNMFYVK